MNDSWDDYAPAATSRQQEQDLVIRFKSALALGLHETVEIQSATKQKRIAVLNDMVCIVDNMAPTIRIREVWPLTVLRDILVVYNIK